MASLIEINGGISRTQDYASMKQQEDMKSVMQQAQSGMRVDEKTEEKSSNVHESENADQYSSNLSSGKDGSGAYQGDGGQKRKKKPEDGKVILKQNSGFDIKI